ncbi:hypothetical protein DIPPA_29272 [Diplonema papillatum]|nr:hypothetical protein DIPPA_29272 [Diplonema papillatum]
MRLTAVVLAACAACSAVEERPVLSEEAVSRMGAALALHPRDSVVYVGSQGSNATGVRALDVSDEHYTFPKGFEECSMQGYVSDAAAVVAQDDGGVLLYVLTTSVAENASAVDVMDVTEAASPSLVNSITFAGAPALALRASQRTLAVTTPTDLLLFSIGGSDEISLASRTPWPGNAPVASVALVGTSAYGLSAQGVLPVDVRDPSSPQQAGFVPFPPPAAASPASARAAPPQILRGADLSADASGTLLFAAASIGGSVGCSSSDDDDVCLYSYALSDPLAPKQESSTAVRGPVHHVAVFSAGEEEEDEGVGAGLVVLVAGPRALQIVNATDLQAPSAAGYVPLDGAGAASAARGRRVYIADYPTRMVAADLKGTVGSSRSYIIFVAGGLAGLVVCTMCAGYVYVKRNTPSRHSYRLLVQ